MALPEALPEPFSVQPLTRHRWTDEEFDRMVDLGIIREGSATEEAEFVVGVANDGDKLALHADVFHLADERFNPRLLRSGYLTEA